jgi:YD repeat-containing protein
MLPNPATGANPPLVEGNSPEPGALVTRYAYDEQGKKISQTDAEARITRWTFDGMSHPRDRHGLKSATGLAWNR